MSNPDRDPQPHQIRLRAAWERVPLGGRVDLPAQWPIDLDSPFQISRRFHRPSFDPARETIFLRLESVPGLVRATLNDLEIFSNLPDLQRERLLVQIPITLAPKNLLVFTVDPAAWRSQPSLSRDWGIVSLSIETLPQAI